MMIEYNNDIGEVFPQGVPPDTTDPRPKDIQYCCALVERVTNWILHLSSLEETSRDFCAMRYLNIYLNAHVIISRLYNVDGTYDFNRFQSMFDFLKEKEGSPGLGDHFKEPGNYTYGNRLYDAAAKVHDVCYFLIRGYSRVLAVDTDRGAVKIGTDINAYDSYYTDLLISIVTLDIKGLASKASRELNPAVWMERYLEAKQKCIAAKKKLKSLAQRGADGVETVAVLKEDGTLQENLVDFVAECVVSEIQRLTLKAVLSLKSEGEEISFGLGIIKRFFQNFSSWNKIYNDLKSRPEVLTNLYVEFTGGDAAEADIKTQEIMRDVCRRNTVVNYDRGPQGLIFRTSARPINQTMDSINTTCRTRFDPNQPPDTMYISMVNRSATVWDPSSGYGEAPLDYLHRTTLYPWAGDIESNLLGEQEFKHWSNKYGAADTGGTEERNAGIQWRNFQKRGKCSQMWTRVVDKVRGFWQNPRHLDNDAYYFYDQDRLSETLRTKLFGPHAGAGIDPGPGPEPQPEPQAGTPARNPSQEPYRE